MSQVGDGGLEIIGDDDCRALLARGPIGRIGLAPADGEPLVLPVNYVFRDDAVYFRTNLASAIDRAAGRVVAFEIDGIDPLFHEGWSVVLVGRLEPVPDPEVVTLGRLPLGAWVPGPRSRLMRVRAQRMSGRSIRGHHGRMPGAGA